MKTLPVEQLTSFLQEAKESGVFEMYYAELAARLRKANCLASNGRKLIWTGAAFG